MIFNQINWVERERERETNHDIILIDVVGIWLSVAQRVLEIIAQRLRVALDRNCYLFACQSSGRLDLLRTRSLCCNKIIVLFIIVRAIATLFRRCSQLHVNLFKKNQNRNEIQAFRDQPQMSGKWLWCDGRRWTYQIRIGGEFVADAQRTAARSHARRDGPVSCVTPTRTAAVAQKEARDAQSGGQLCRKRSSQLVTAALYSDGLLQRPRHTTCTPTIKDPRKMIRKCFNNNCYKSLANRIKLHHTSWIGRKDLRLMNVAWTLLQTTHAHLHRWRTVACTCNLLRRVWGCRCRLLVAVSIYRRPEKTRSKEWVYMFVK